MQPTITVFEQSPDRGRGLSRDMRVRWAFEEVGQPYDVRLVTFEAMKDPGHRALHPFGQIPTYEEGDLALFESGAIVLRIAETHRGLLPDDSNARSRAIMWMFAALNTIETPIIDLIVAKFVEGGEPWAEARLPLVMARIHAKLSELSGALGDCEWLEDTFSAGDLMMIGVTDQAEGVWHSQPSPEPSRLRGAWRGATRLPTCVRRSAGSVQSMSERQGDINSISCSTQPGRRPGHVAR